MALFVQLGRDKTIEKVSDHSASFYTCLIHQSGRAGATCAGADFIVCKPISPIDSVHPIIGFRSNRGGA